jgi:serine/threonine protein kinase
MLVASLLHALRAPRKCLAIIAISVCNATPGDLFSVSRGWDVSDTSNAVLAKHANCLPIGTRISDFEIVDLIGEGGFGIVYLARDLELDRTVAIKEFMPAAFAGRVDGVRVAVRAENHRNTFDTGLKSFINEARMLAKFSHPALLEVFRFWEGNGTAYMVMRLYKGKTLRESLNERKEPFTESEVAQIMGPIFDALEMLHRDQIYHRDIAPDNIMLTEGRSVLLDFGSARRIIGDATQALTTVLKPGYAPIEQYSDDGSLKQGAWTDVYALGAVLYHLATGKAPLQAVSRMLADPLADVATATQGRFSDVFSQAVVKAMSVHVANRFQSVTEFRQALGWDVGLSPRVVTMPSQQLWLEPENAPPRTGQPPPVTVPRPTTIRSDPQPSPAKVPPVPQKAKSNAALYVGALAVAGIAIAGGWYALRPAAPAAVVQPRTEVTPPASPASTNTDAPIVTPPAPSIAADAPAPVQGEGTVRFTTKLQGRVDINGIARGWSSSIGDVKLPVGTHTIDIIVIGSPPVTRTIEIKKDEVVVVN